MAVPKRRVSRSRRGNRRADTSPPKVPLVACKNCSSSIRPHHICPACGYYRGRQMVVAKST